MKKNKFHNSIQTQLYNYALSTIKNYKIKVEFLVEKSETTSEKCLAEYKKRIKAEGQLLGFPFFTEKKSQSKFEITGNINSAKSKKEWDEMVKTIKKENTGRVFGAGTITFRHPKNTRGNSANVEAFIGTAIILLEMAESDLEKDIISSVRYLQVIAEVCGIATGRLDKKSSKEIREKRNEEIQKEINEILKRNPSLSSTGATEKAIKNLGLPKSALRNSRRLAPKKVKK